MTHEQQKTIQTYSLMIIATVLFGAAMTWLKPVLIPFVLSLMLTAGLTPMVQWLSHRLKCPEWMTILLTLGVGVVVFLGLSVLVGQSLQTAVAKTDEFEARLTGVYEAALTQLAQFGLPLETTSIKSHLQSLPIGKAFGSIATHLLNVLSDSFLVIFFMIYLLQSALSRSKDIDPNSISQRIHTRVRQYLAIKMGLSILTGIFVWITLVAFGVPMAAMFGVLTVVLNFIPSVGSIVAVLLPLPFIALDPAFSIGAILTILAITMTVQMIVGNVLEPKMMGELLELHPITILVALVFWGTMWGVPGMFLAVPLTAVVSILLYEFTPTRGIALLFSGKTESVNSTKGAVDNE